MRYTRSVLIAPLILIAACVPRTEAPAPAPPAPTPAPLPTPTPTPVPTYSSWEDAPQTPGDWSYAGGTATFGQLGRPRLTMTCAGGNVQIAIPQAPSGLITVRTETATRGLQANAGVVALTARDPLLDAIAFSKGRFAVEAGGQALYVPAWPEISRVIEDCRR